MCVSHLLDFEVVLCSPEYVIVWFLQQIVCLEVGNVRLKRISRSCESFELFICFSIRRKIGFST